MAAATRVNLLAPASGSLRRASVSAALLAGLALACAEADASTAAVLSAGFAPDLPKEGLELAVPLSRAAWRAAPEPSTWIAADPFAGCELPRRRDAEARLELDGLPVARSVEPASDAPSWELGPAGVRLRVPGAAEPPVEASWVLPLSAGRPAPSALGGSPPRWRVYLDNVTSDALPLVPGRPQGVTLDVPARARLDLATSCVGPATEEPARLAVKLDGVTFALLFLPVTREVEVLRHALELPSAARRAARLSFELSGPPCFVALHTPVLGVRPAGAPAVPDRPPIVLFLADTFRADNLASYGGEAEVAPRLDALADESLRFARVWSPAAWTLPAHASLFLGLHPYQHGTTRKLARLSGELVTLAEWLAAAGYRTGAVTNGAYVSASYGMDRGFEWFEEKEPTDLPGTLAAARAFLAADDGRPAFLFMHTYRVHGPYRASGETLRSHGERLGLEEGLHAQRELVRTIAELRADGGSEPAQQTFRQLNLEGTWIELLTTSLRARGVAEADVAAELQRTARTLKGLYLGGVVDLDRALGGFLDDLEGLGCGRDRGFFVFTSDHGEAFCEHDALFHGRGAWEELLRIPLLVRGPGVAPGASESTGTLVDLAPTLCALAGLPPAPGWAGRSLLEPGDSALAFDCAEAGASAVIVEGPWKLALPADEAAVAAGEVQTAFDLASDPLERSDLVGAGSGEEEAWRAVLARRLAGLQAALVPLHEADSVEADPELLRELEALGYFGAGEER